MEGGDARGGTKAGYEEEDEGLDDDGGGGCCWGGAGAVTARNPGFSKDCERGQREGGGGGPSPYRPGFVPLTSLANSIPKTLSQKSKKHA